MLGGQEGSKKKISLQVGVKKPERKMIFRRQRKRQVGAHEMEAKIEDFRISAARGKRN